METLPLIFVSLLGLCAGSFALALTDRMYARKDWVRGRSACDHCSKQLETRDLIPVISWVLARGRCRHCHKKLSVAYPLTELATGLAFLISAIWWPYGLHPAGVAIFSLWLVMLTLLVSLVVFDVRWHILPDKIMYTLIGIIGASRLFQALYYSDMDRLVGTLFGVVVGWGIFFALYQLSRGKYIGGGDVKLGLFYGLLLASGFKSLLVISIGSLIGTLMVLPSLVQKKTKMSSQIPFGPSLIAATFIMYIWGDRIIELLTSTYLFP